MGAVASSLQKFKDNKANANDGRYDGIIQYLIQTGYPIHSGVISRRDSRRARLTAYLHLAVKFHFTSDAIQLIKLGAIADSKSHKGESTLQLAVVNKRDVTLMEEIVPNGIQYRKMKFYGLESLHFATAARTKKRIKELAATQEVFDSAQSHRLVKMLLDAQANVNNKDVNNCSPIQCAIYTGDLELVKILIDAGANINSRNRIGATALHDAVLCCNEEMVLLLLRRGADVSIQTDLKGNTALHWASMLNIDNSHEGIVRKLLEFGSDLYKPNAKCRTPFNCIVQCCDVNLVRVCIDEYKADLKKVAPGTNNALAFAVQNVNENVMNLVLESETEINHKSKYGTSPLHYASQLSMLKNVRRLISMGADVNAKESDGVTPLYQCIFQRNFNSINLPLALQRANFAEQRRRVIWLLLESGGDVNQKLFINRNPVEESLLKLMIVYREIEALNITIEYAAEVEARSNKPLFDDSNLTLINEKPKIKKYYQMCQAELTAMKATKVGPTSITYFSVLTDPLNVTARYARNEEFVKTFEAGDYRTAYTIYASRLKEKFDAAIVRRNMIERVSSTLSETLQFADPTNIAFEIIFKCLSEADIKLLIGSEFFEN